jgi:glycosyltransferase involved in cell wall biosynthesis
MRILSITAGAAGMYCGSCLRDNALATALKALGHDVLLLPLYTPTLTDEPNVSERRVFFGGVSVYLKQNWGVFRKTPRVLDRLWDSAAVIRAATRLSVSTDPRLLGELTVSMLQGEEGKQKKEIQKLLDWLKEQPRPDVINLPNSLLISLARPLKQALGSPICCTLQGEDLFLEGLPEPHRGRAIELIRQNVRYVDAFLPVSEFCARLMSDYLGLPASGMHVVPLGINTEGFTPRARSGDAVFTVGYFARIAPEKGLHNLAEAYRRLAQRPEFREARLEAAGYLAPEHRRYLEGIERQMKDAGLAAEFKYRGSLDRRGKVDFLKKLDVLSVPSGYKEPKGLYLLEAMACGVPVVQPRHGAFPEIIEKTGGGLLFQPDDPESLADALLALRRHRSQREEMGRRGAEAVRAHYSVSRMAERTLEVYRGLAQTAAPAGREVAARPS